MSSVQCATCKKEFDWDEAYNQQHTPGSHLHNPPGHGNFRPRAFCPQCGSLVAEWDVDRYADRNRWKWYGENAKVNRDTALPPSPIVLWGRPLPADAETVVSEERIDLELVTRLLRPAKKEGGTKEISPETKSPAEIFRNASAEIDNWLQSRGGNLDRSKQTFQDLVSYVEGEGASDARAIALQGMIEYYDGKKDAARARFDRAAILDESCALCHLGLGMLDYWEVSAAQRGVERLTRAIALEPSLLDAYVWRARIQKQKLNDSAAAWNSLQDALSTIGEDRLKEHPRGHSLFIELGQVCIYDGKSGVDDALHYFEAALQMNPNNYTAPMYLMQLYRALGRPADAARAQAAYEKADQGVGLSSQAIDAIRAFVTKSASRPSEQKQSAPPATAAAPKFTADPAKAEAGVKRPAPTAQKVPNNKQPPTTSAKQVRSQTGVQKMFRRLGLWSLVSIQAGFGLFLVLFSILLFFIAVRFVISSDVYFVVFLFVPAGLISLFYGIVVLKKLYHLLKDEPDAETEKPPVTPHHATKPALTIENFAQETCKSSGSITLPLTRVSALIKALTKYLQAADPGVSLDQAFKQAKMGLTLKCPRCGVFNEETVSVLFASEFMRDTTHVTFGGPNVAALAKGICPGCGQTEVEAHFDPMKARAVAIFGVGKGSEYVRECVQQKYKELPESRTWQSDHAFRTVLDPLNSGDNVGACRAAEALISRFIDFAPLYGWWGEALLRIGSFDTARDLIKHALDKTKQKHLLCNHLGKVEWKARNIREAVYWWAQGLHCQESLKEDNYGNDEGAYLYLHYVAEGVGLSECSSVFIMRADQIRPGMVRFDTQTANDLISLSRTAKETPVAEVLQKLVTTYFVPKKQESTKANPEFAFSYVKDSTGKIYGVWVKNEADANNQTYAITLFLRGGLTSEKITGNLRAVPNRVDNKGGYFVMLGSYPAPGEN
jgi:tetratricopeptide (TPR) repeat protein